MVNKLFNQISMWVVLLITLSFGLELFNSGFITNIFTGGLLTIVRWIALLGAGYEILRMFKVIK